MQLGSSLSILWHCLSLVLEWKLTFSSPVATAEFSKFAGILSASLLPLHLNNEPWFSKLYSWWMSFPGGSVVKNLPAKAGDMSLIPGSRRSPGEGNGNPLQCSCLENPTDRGTWWATVHGVAKSRTWLSNWTTTKTADEYLYSPTEQNKGPVMSGCPPSSAIFHVIVD